MRGILGLDRRALDRARFSRDPRFDGKFFIAVVSTGIYCRPVCPSPTAKRANVRYYPTAAAAAEAGFRPCLRCRPEAAPGTPAWLGTSAVVRRALRLIHDGVLDGGSVETLAADLGIGARHLHRLFVQHVGASPIAVAQTRRLHFAKRLLDETQLPMLQIALAAGFGSLRRFNDAVRKTYGRAPRELRRQRGATAGDDVALRLAYRPPYDWAQVSGALAARALPGVERVDERGYARTVAIEGGSALVCVHPVDGEDALELRVRGAPAAALFGLSAAARRTFDLGADPARIATCFARDPLLAPLAARHPGVRILGAWEPFEHAARVALGAAEDGVAAGARAARLVAAFGAKVAPGVAGLTHLFPTAEALARGGVDGLGLGRARAAVVLALARAVAGGVVDLRAPADELVAALAALPGFDDSAAQLVALRVAGEPDAFPGDDPVLRRAGGEARAEAWRPWRGYAAELLWLSAASAAASSPRRHTRA